MVYTRQKQVFSFVFFTFTMAMALPAQSQVSGCKDPTANNYNPAATINNGTCSYNTTFYEPEVRANPINDELLETSGLQMAGNFLWSFNDGGNTATIYRIDTLTDAILQTVHLSGATNVDWEDMAFDGTYFYIGDFGNNETGGRTDLKIYKFLFSLIPDHTTNPVASIAAEDIFMINFTYNGRIPKDTTANATEYDCEAMIVDGGKIHLFSKNWIKTTTTHYVISGTTAGNYTADSLETLATNYLVTGAAITPNGKAVALLGYQNTGFRNHFMHLLSDFSGGTYFNGNKRRIDLPTAFTMGQAEGICFRTNSYGYISNEGVTNPIIIKQKLHAFNTSALVPLSVLPINLLDFAVRNRDENHEISWKFTEPVKELIVFQSKYQDHFKEIKRFTASQAGTVTIKGEAGKSCYKLSWEEGDRSSKSSNIICLNKESGNSISHVVLRRSGALSFVFNDNNGNKCFLRLIGTDGKLLAQTARFLTPGSHLLQLNQSFKSGIAIVQLIKNGKQESLLVRVEQ